MSYDGYGNIRTKNGKAYTYGNSVWKDLLTSYGGQAISYDAQGNPTSYLGHTLTWEKGRQLKSFDSNAYTYNASGIRMTKTVGGVKHTYTLDGTKIIREVWGGNTLFPLYDVDDSVCGINYNGNYYYFAKNLQGDIIAIVDKDAKTVARYSYDAWGVPTVVSDSSGRSIATVNPFRYRGYYYDAEIGMYYLQSRYYNPVVGRFVNADEIICVAIDSAVLSCNIVAYCKNNPSTFVDPSGCYAAALHEDIPLWGTLIASAVPAVAAAKAAIAAAIKSALAFLWNVFVIVGLIVLVILLILAIYAASAKIIEVVKKAMAKKDKSSTDGYVVYVLARTEDDVYSIFYVGRTKNFEKRMSAHSRTKGKFVSYIVMSCHTLIMSRLVEQAVLTACINSKIFNMGKNRKDPASNAINGIAKSKIGNFKENMKDLASLLNCTGESDFYNFMGI